MTQTIYDKGTWTLDEWLEAEIEPRFELENGRLVPMPSPTRRHQVIVGRVFNALFDKCLSDESGAVSMEVDVALPTGQGLIPDLSLIRKERETELLTSSGKIQGVPDLVVEVISPSTRARDTVHKMRIYHEAGVPWYWLIDSETLTIQEYQHTPEGYLLRTAAEAGEVFHSKAVEGFTINLRQLVGEQEG